ncbi:MULTISPECIES: hypothetical protein [Paenibacillus]|uniref:Uncharacterized protein n=1 Tax=Paenibacillus pabuli TaxID=1472 RepID=A0A855XUC4_9BACL|nr:MULTISPECIES: hypothetical protein [Paenibacillus]PWW37363.1 hypothetical protein DET56_109249 [Paenibacillus pabuli]PXW05505.1 hypothetical protein DEU73_108248 [Paenibacillus taichungensis]
MSNQLYLKLQVENVRLQKELEEAQQAMSEPHKNLWLKYTNERNRAEEARRGAERALSSHRFMEDELLKAKRALERANYALNAISMGEWACTFDEQELEVWTTRRINPGRIAREALALVGQEGEGNRRTVEVTLINKGYKAHTLTFDEE